MSDYQNIKIIICGFPKSGKSTLAWSLHMKYDIPIRHCDDIIDKSDWSSVSSEVEQWINQPAPWIIEGVATVRALRKWINNNPDIKMNDMSIIYLGRFLEIPSSGQINMANGCKTIWCEIENELRNRGAKIVFKEDTEAFSKKTTVENKRKYRV